LLTVALVLAGCEGGGTERRGLFPMPAPGRIPGATYVSTPAGEVSVADGNLLLAREDLPVDTRLGRLRVGETFNTAEGRWVDWLDLRYDGAVLVDEHGTRLDEAGLEGTRWVRVDERSLRTRGGRIYHFEDGRLADIKASFPDSPSLTFERDGQGRLTRILQHLGGAPREETVLEIRYEGSSVLLESYGRTARRVLDPQGRMEAAQDPAAFETDAAPTRYLYDAGGRLAAIADPTGVVTTIGYDDDGRVEGVTRGPEHHRFAYHLGRGVYERFSLVHVDPTGAITEYRHNGSGRVTWRRDPTGAIWRAGYRGALLVWREDPLGARWSFDYAGGERIARTDPGGVRESWEPEPGGWNPLRDDEAPWRHFEDARGGVWMQAFDPYGRPVTQTDPVGAEHGLEYQGAALRSVRNPTGFASCFGYDAPHGKVTSVDRGCANSPYFFLQDEVGRPLQEVGGGLRVFDGSDRIREIVFPDAENEDSPRFVFERDAAGRLLASESPYGSRFEFERDEGGRVIGVRERTGWDEETWSELWVDENIERDPAGRVTLRHRPDGERVDLARDSHGRVVELRYLDPLGVPLAEIRLERDAAGRIVRIDDSREAGPTVIERDLAGRPRIVRYPHGEWLAQDLGPAGDLRRLELYTSDGALLRRFDWVRDRLGRPVELYEDGDLVGEATYTTTDIQLRWRSGVTQERVFDEMGRLARLVLREPDGTPLRELELSYLTIGGIPTGHLRRVVDRTHTGEGLSVNYDEGGRVAAWFGDWLYSLRWDLLGNLHLRRFWGPADAEGFLGLAYNLTRTRLSRIGRDGVDQDARGRVIRIGDRAIEWEPFDRPRRLGSIELRYSTLGTPISRTVQGEETRFLFGGLVQADTNLRPKILELGGILVDLRTGEHEVLHRDFRNNVAWVTDDVGALIAFRRFGPFGTRELEGESRSARGFAGGEEVGEFVLIGARVYFPRAARFLSPDPVPDWINRYTYAHGDPLNFWDPDGLERKHTKTLVELEVIGPPRPAARMRIAVEELVVDEPSPKTAESDEAGEESGSGGADPGAEPGTFPEVPNTPTIPDLNFPPHFGGCDAISTSPNAIATLLALLPLLVLLLGRRARSVAHR
jgi:RHS repeat-associated protein